MGKIKTKALIFIVVLGVAAAGFGCGVAGNQAETGINTDPAGRALRGFDAVAYFTVNNAVQGNPKYEYLWNGAMWLFENEENLAKFKANPEAYAPQFGGFCSYAVSEGYTANGDPEAWKVVDGKLYLNYNKEVKKKWEQNMEERIEKGRKNWIEFKSKKPDHKG